MHRASRLAETQGGSGASGHDTVNGGTAAVGRWQYNAAEDTIDVVNAINVLNQGAEFVCKLKNQNGAGLAGSCLDQTQLSDGPTGSPERVTTAGARQKIKSQSEPV